MHSIICYAMASIHLAVGYAERTWTCCQSRKFELPLIHTNNADMSNANDAFRLHKPTWVTQVEY